MREMSEEFMAKITAAGDWWRAHEFPPVQEQGGTHKKKNWRLRLCSNPGYEMKQRIVASWLELLMMIDKRRHALGLSLEVVSVFCLQEYRQVFGWHAAPDG